MTGIEDGYWDPAPRKARLASILDRATGGAVFHVIFICGGNICRSPYAEMRFEQLLHQRCNSNTSITISSGGFINNKVVHEFTRKALLEAGVSGERVEQFFPRNVRKHKEEMAGADLLLVPTKGVIETLLPRRYWDKAFLFSELDDGKQEDIEDPALLKEYEVYRAIMDRIDPSLERLVDRFVESGACKP